MTNKERSKAIRETLKKAGYKTSDFSIRSHDCGYSDATDISIKNLSIKENDIRKLLKGFESVDYDKYSGEILSGGNTYISIHYDYSIVCAEGKAVEPEINKILDDLEKELKAKGYASYKIGDLRITAGVKSWSVFEYPYEHSDVGIGLFLDVSKEDIPCRIRNRFAIAKAQNKVAA